MCTVWKIIIMPEITVSTAKFQNIDEKHVLNEN